MNSERPIHLPTEIVLQIVTTVAADEFTRQASLHACCLVSRQWYSAAIALLYEKPRIKTGTAFTTFTNTISPRIGVRRSKGNLGALVHRLDLSSLVHHSSPSLTARLLGRVKENLEVLVAPRTSFSTNSLPALAKCSKLRHLDLSLVGTAIPFATLKKTIRNLHNLLSIRLPQSTSITTSDSFSIPWPPLLRRLQLSGTFSPTIMPAFPWPPSLTTLKLKNCTDLSIENLSSLLSSPTLGTSLKRLTISCHNRQLDPESIDAIPAFLPALSFLSIPGDLVWPTFFDLLTHVSVPTLEVLELGDPSYDPILGFEIEDLAAALRRGLLPGLRAVGFSHELIPDKVFLDDYEINAILIRREKMKRKSAWPGAGVGDSDSDIETGVYYF